MEFSDLQASSFSNYVSNLLLHIGNDKGTHIRPSSLQMQTLRFAAETDIHA